MGCDIHVFTEVYKDGKWNHVDTLVESREYFPYNVIDNYPAAPYYIVDSVYDDRNYQVFSILAGVRGSYEPIDQPRGFPDNLSDTLQEIVDFHFEHTSSWLTLKELMNYNYWGLSAEEKEWVGWFFDRNNSQSAISKLKRIARGHEVRSEDVRIVFWFDS